MAPRQALPERRDRVLGPLGVVAPPPIHIVSPSFEGSLATLFHCVREHRVDLLEVPLLPICEAYLSYVVSNAEMDLDEAAAALAALAYLLERKAFMLLPVPEADEVPVDDPLELPDPTVGEYSVAIDMLRLWQEERERLYFRSPDAGPNPYELPYTLKDVSSNDLALAFERLLHRAEPDMERPTGKARRSLTEMMQVVLLAVCHEWRSVVDLVQGKITRTEAVYWFLALLELVRLGQVAVRLEEETVLFARA